MDAESQQNHLKAYGITYWVLNKQQKAPWKPKIKDKFDPSNFDYVREEHICEDPLSAADQALFASFA